MLGGIDVEQTGPKISRNGIEVSGFADLKAAHWNHEAPALYEFAIRRNEGVLSAGGPLIVTTGEHTGRSARDKHIVLDDETKDTIWWDNNRPISPENFERLHCDMLAHAKGQEIFVQDLYAGSDPDHRLAVRVCTQYAWHSLFIRNLLIEPPREDLESFTPQLTIIDLPSFQADPSLHGTRSSTAIALDFTRNIVLICGTAYAGEMKKSVFSVLNYHLPSKKVMPMHCSINVGQHEDSAVFFGLSGTGKTTLSADPDRQLVGDDEHGWSPNGVFNFEGGCYAKMINLSAKAEPQIFETTKCFGTVLENVAINQETREIDLNDGSLTENTRGAYPLSFIPNIVPGARAGHPTAIIMLTADAFGVLPPIAKLSPSAAMYHFLSGYTAKIAGTERGVKEPEATFSACFGAPFMPRPPSVYGNLLRELIAQHDVKCWLVNTGWTGGPYGEGHRMPIDATRRLLAAALNGELDKVKMRYDPLFRLEVPESVMGIDDHNLLNPREAWADKQAYDAQARKLLNMFIENFRTFAEDVDDDVRAAAPALPQAAE